MRRRAVIQMIVIGLLTGLFSGAVAYFIPWLPEAASSEAGKIDLVYWFVAIICALIFALVAGVSLYAGWKFRAPPDDEDDGSPIHGHTGLEIVWTAIPTVLVVAMSVVSGIVLIQIEDVENPRRVEVVTQQFAWNFRDPELDRRSGELVLQVDQPVELILTSRDVIHSFWVPEFRMKQDAVPGIETRTVITPTKEGTFPVICTELCGLGHAAMRARARVLSAADFEAWANEADETGGEDGEVDAEAVFQEAGCGSCHALSDAGTEAAVGPDLDKVLAGDHADADHVRESIVNPNAEITEGYQPNVMPQDYEERLSGEELDALVTYLLETAGA